MGTAACAAALLLLLLLSRWIAVRLPSSSSSSSAAAVAAAAALALALVVPTAGLVVAAPNRAHGLAFCGANHPRATRPFGQHSTGPKRLCLAAAARGASDSSSNSSAGSHHLLEPPHGNKRKNAGHGPAAVSSLTRSQAVAVVRKFRDAGAYGSIVRFVKSAAAAAAPREPDSVVYAEAISALCRDSPNQALEVFHEMEAAGIAPTSSVMEAVMTAIANLYEGDVDTILFWQERLREAHPTAWDGDARAWDATLAALADNNCNNPDSLEACLMLYQVMKQQQQQHPNAAPGTRTYQILFQACADREDGSAAETLLDDLLAGKRPSTLLTPRLWSTVLRALAAVGDSAACRRVLRTIVELGSAPTVHHYTFYIHSLLPDTKQMLAVLLHMKNGNENTTTADGDLTGLPPVPPDAVAIKAVLRLCGLVGDFDNAHQVLAWVRQGEFGTDVKADEAMYNLVLVACGDSGQAKSVIREMRLTRRHRVGCIPPSRVSYTHAITACRRAADLASAQLFLRMARVDGVDPDVVMYTAAVWASARARNVTAATSLLEEMQVHNCTPNEISYNGVLDACAGGGEAAEAMRIYQEMTRRGLRPTGQTYQLLARSIRAEENATTKVTWLQGVYDTMNSYQRAAETGGPIVDALIQGLASLHRFDDALEIFTSVRGRPNDSSVRSILSACRTVSPPRWEEALSILHSSDEGSASGAPAPVDPIALGYAMLACSKADQFEES
jgi:pentatricopeptide repeat protein